MKEFFIIKDRDFLMSRMGDISQLAGLKRYELIDGKAKGIEAVDFNTGTGFCFTVLPGRGMDIAWANFRGIPVSYISKTGIVSPTYYEHDGMNWLRSFFAGLLTTCGLTNVGSPCEEEDSILGLQKEGLHGRISNMGADNVCTCEEWKGNEYVMKTSGRMRQSMLHGENLTLKREITAEMGKSKLVISDIVSNEGFSVKPLMILYHINIGYPILDEGSRFITSSKSVEPTDIQAAEHLHRYNVMQYPINGQKESSYYHTLNSAENGDTYAGIVNDKLEIGVYVKFNKNQLPKMAQWNQLSKAEYVLGIEPANCWTIGRVEHKKRGDLEYIEPGEMRRFELEIGILAEKKQIEEFENKVKRLC